MENDQGHQSMTKLERYRRSAKLSYAQLAAHLGVSSKGHIYKLCQGVHGPGLALAREIERRTKGAVKVGAW